VIGDLDALVNDVYHIRGKVVSKKQALNVYGEEGMEDGTISFKEEKDMVKVSLGGLKPEARVVVKLTYFKFNECEFD
jgi:hypothetical protein